MAIRKRKAPGPVARRVRAGAREPRRPLAAKPSIQRILCPVDFSEFSRRAVTNAVALARAFESEITALFVFPLLTVADGDPACLPAPALPDAGVRSVVAKDLKQFLAPAREAGVPVRLCLKTGDPVKEILAQAAALPADLIVMGTHGRSGFERWVLGSVADKVLRKSPCPVVMGSKPSEPAAVPGQRILCAVDLSKSSARTLAYALSLARRARVPITLLHVVEQVSEPKGPASYRSRGGRDLEAEARKRLHKAAPGEREGCEIEEAVVTGKPYREILRVAAERDAGLIVMGTYGQNPVDRMFFGSTVDHVVRDAPCPVLTVRPGSS